MKETIKKFLSHHIDHTSLYHWCVPDFWLGVYLKNKTDLIRSLLSHDTNCQIIVVFQKFERKSTPLIFWMQNWKEKTLNVLMRRMITYQQGCRQGVGAGGASAPPVFDRSVNPISTRGGWLCPPQYYQPPRIFRPCDGPALGLVPNNGRS